MQIKKTLFSLFVGFLDDPKCQKPPVKDRWHEFATSQKSEIFDDYQKPRFLKLRVVFDHYQNSTII